MQSYTFENCTARVKVSLDGLPDHTGHSLNRTSVSNNHLCEAAGFHNTQRASLKHIAVLGRKPTTP